jgi:hypothetical protein
VFLYLIWYTFDSYYREIELWKDFLDDPYQHISRERFRELLKYVYSEETNPRFVGMPRRLSILHEQLCILGFFKTARYLPASAKVIPRDVTKRVEYEAEKRLYRTARRSIEILNTINRRSYEEYVLIAKKYDWDYEIPDEKEVEAGEY